MIKVKLLVFIILFCLTLVVCNKTPQQQAVFSKSESEFVMGTICTITLFAPDSTDFALVFNETFKRLHEIENLMSANVSGTKATVSGTSPAVSGTGAAVSGTSANVSGTSPAVSGTGAAVSDTKAAVSGTSAAVSGTKATVSGTGPAVSGTKGNVSGTGAAVSGTGPAVSGTGADVSCTSAAVSGTSPAVSDTSAVVSGTGAAVSGTGPAVSGTGADVSGTSPAVSGTGADVSGTSPAVSDTGANVSDTGAVVSGTKAAVSDTGPAVSGTGANVSGADINRVNQYAGQYALMVNAETIAVVERALYYAEQSDGAFDPTVGPLVKLWGIGTETPRLPSQDEIAQALSLVNWRDVSIEPESGTLFLKRPGMALDLGAIAKGYAADEVARILAKAGIPGAIIDLGGNIFAYGLKNPNEPAAPWRIGVQNPLDTRGAYLGILELQNKSVVTSGVYERYADIDGILYHHILSTCDGYPVQNGLLSVTIIANSSIESDALSTTVFVLGYEQGRALVERMDGVEALFVFEDKTIRATSGAQAMFTLSDDSYRFMAAE